MTSPPPADVLGEFGVSGRPRPLAGGQQPVWRVGDLVLKRCDTSADTVRWQAGVLGRIGPGAGVRVAPPVPSVSGAWVVRGWTASPFLSGRPAGQDWRTVMAAGHALHLALAGVTKPPFIEVRDDVWARADRTVWDLAAAPPHPQLEAGFEARRPVDLADRLVHGDLTGNVLVDDAAAPAVLDLSPYWRPAPWATAVVCADAMVHAHAELRTVLAAARAATGSEPSGQILLRAVLFRLVTDAMAGRDPGAGTTLDQVVRHATSAP